MENFKIKSFKKWLLEQAPIGIDPLAKLASDMVTMNLGDPKANPASITDQLKKSKPYLDMKNKLDSKNVQNSVNVAIAAAKKAPKPTIQSPQNKPTM